MLIPWTIGNENTRVINGFETQANNIDMAGTNECLEGQESVTNTESKVSRSKIESIADDDQLSDNSEQQGNSSLINSINNFTAELKAKLQTFSFLNETKLRLDNVLQFDELDSSQCFHDQTNCNSSGLVTSEKCSDVVSVKYKENLDAGSKKHKKSSFCNKDILVCNGGRRNDSKICNGDYERSQAGSFKRYYHVFIKDELSELVQSVRALNVITQYYDHGNWVVRAEKRKNQE